VFVGDLADLTRAPRFRTAPDPDVTSDRLAAFNQRIAATVAAHGAVLVRLSAMPIDDSIFYSDGFHPNNAGYLRIADAFWAEMGRALGRTMSSVLKLLAGPHPRELLAAPAARSAQRRS
jgi:hypothetical protein